MPDGFSRRAFLALAATVVVGACSGDDAGPPTTASGPPDPGEPTGPTTGPATSGPPPTVALAGDPFGLGVTAGDPDATSVVLWTRLVGVDLADEVAVRWETSADDFATVAASGDVTATAADGHSVHAVVPAAGPVTYRFRAGGFTSAVGRAGPATVADGALRVAAMSCQHFETGRWAAHRDVAEWAPDAVVFLGDFVYEGAGRDVGGEVVRSHAGPEATDLAGYRARYEQYLGDEQLRASRAACPWWVIWDDHEVENDYAALTPQDPAEQATFAARRLAAYQAWWEHMPVRIPRPRDGVDTVITRAGHYDDLLDLVLLDGRQFRSDQACGGATMSLQPACAEADDPARTMLGTTQEQWLAPTFGAAGATWTALGQQTMLTDVRLPNGAVINDDQWDGYAPARARLLAAAAPVAGRLVVLTGDLHLAGVGHLGDVGTEFITTAVSSVNRIPVSMEPLLAGFPAIAAAELRHRGYVRHTVTPATWTAEYRTVDDAADAASPVSTWRTFTLEAGAAGTVGSSG